MSWDVILPFLKPIEPFLRDPEISDILVNGSSGVFVEKNGRLIEVRVQLAEKPLQVAIRNIARVLGDEINEETPLLDARLPDGSRVAAVFPPCSVRGTTLAIRKFQTARYDVEGLVRAGTVTPAVLAQLERAVKGRQNIVISGRTGAGKTTLLNALATFIPSDQRVVVIEDTSELQLAQANLVRLEARRGQPGVAAVTIRDLVRATLRLRPDRILLGEIRGEEAFDLLQAVNTGHGGTLATTHANSAASTLERLATCALMADVRLPHAVIRRQIGCGIQLLVHLDVERGRRQVREVMQVNGYDVDHDRYECEVLYAA